MGTPAAAGSSWRDRARLGGRVPRRHGGQRRPPRHRRGPRRQHRRPPVGGQRLPRHAQRLRAARRLARRPLRAQAGVPARAGRLHRRLHAVRAGSEHRGPHRAPDRCRASGAALLVPGSLAIISAAFHPDDRAAAVGVWSGLGGVAGAIGPFVGGYLIDSVSWRLAFFINLPLAVGVVVASRHVPESRADGAPGLDLRGRRDGVGGARPQHLRADRGRPGDRGGRPRRAGGCSWWWRPGHRRRCSRWPCSATGSSAAPTSPPWRCTPPSAAPSSCSSSSCRSPSATRPSRPGSALLPVTLLMVAPLVAARGPGRSASGPGSR